MKVEGIIQELTGLIENEIEANPVDAILFSGGIDTALLAALAFRE